MIEHFMQLDYELLSLSLDIEVNADMAPERLRKAVEARLRQMNERERKALPVPVWECLEALMPPEVSVTKMNPNKPGAGQENRSYWFSVSKESGRGVLTLTPKKQTPEEFLKSLREKERFRVWEKAHRVRFKTSSTVVMMTAPILEDLPAAFCKTVLESF